MIEQISITNFKCFKDKTTFDFGKVTIFTGYNGRGKSTVLQALLLLSQSYLKEKKDELHLDGEWLRLGNYLDLVNVDNNGSLLIELEFKTDEKTSQLVNLGYDATNDDMVGSLKECLINNENYFDSLGNATESDILTNSRTLTRSIPTNFSKMLETIHFISANRRGPTKYVDKHEIPELHRVGKDGDYTINTLASYNELLKSDLKFNLNEDSSTNLQSSTSIWMSYIMDGGGIIGLQGIERSSSVL
jgi:AAA15 family ATPase/GTPase